MSGCEYLLFQRSFSKHPQESVELVPTSLRTWYYFLSVTCPKADTLSRMEWYWVCSGLGGIKCVLYFIFACSWRASISDKSLNLQIGESGENQILLENCNPPEPTLPDNVRCNNRKSIRNLQPAIQVCVCVRTYAHTCSILTEINAVARIHPLAEVVFDGGVDSSRVQCVCICVSISQPREAEERADSRRTDSTDASVCLDIHSRSTAAEFEQTADLHRKNRLDLDQLQIQTTRLLSVCLLFDSSDLIFNLGLRFYIGSRGKDIDKLFIVQMF